MSYHSTSKDNIVHHNISYKFAFGSNSLSHISQDIRVTYNFYAILTTFLAYLLNHQIPSKSVDSEIALNSMQIR